MRITRLFVASCASLFLAVPAIAQQPPSPSRSPNPTRTVDDYVCAFTGECSKTTNPADNSVSAPATRGFRLSAPERRTAPSAAAAPSTPSSATAIPRRGNAQRASTRRASSRSASAAMHPRSIDLRVSFLLGSAQLTDQAQEEARVFAKALLLPALSSNHFRIEGHTDSSGTRAINLDLSRRRAQAVADYLATLGVQSDRLQVRGYGPDRPLPGHSPRSPENRRVEAQLL